MRNLSSRRRRMSGGADESLAQGKNFAANMPGQMGGGNVYHGAPVLAGDAMLLDGDLRGKAGVEGLDASTAAIRGMQDGGSRRSRSRSNRRGRNNASARRSRSRRGRNNAPMRRGRNNASARRGRNNASARRGRNNASARRGRNNASARRSRNNASARRNRKNASARRGRNNVSARSRRGRKNASARRNRSRRNQMGGDGEEEYMPEVYEDAVTPVQRRNGNSRNMYGGAHNLIPTQYAPVTQSPSLLSASAAARAGTAFSSDPFANGSGSA